MTKRHARGAVATRTAPKASNNPVEADAPELSVDEVVARYLGEWILMQVTAYDDDQWPARGRILAHHSSYTKVGKAWLKALASSEPGDLRKLYYVFTADRLLRTGEELDQALVGLRQQDDLDLFRWLRV